MRLLPGALLVLLAVTTAAAAAPPRAPERTVPCAEAIDEVRFPFVGNREPRHRFRTVLGAISLPPAYVEQTVRQPDPRWPYWSKYGVVVRAGGGRVTLSVPRAWRPRVGITWGNAGYGALAVVTFTSCSGPRANGHAYAGGFFLRSRSACFPLDVTAGGRGARVWFGVGRRCADQRQASSSCASSPWASA